MFGAVFEVKGRFWLDWRRLLDGNQREKLERVLGRLIFSLCSTQARYFFLLLGSVSGNSRGLGQDDRQRLGLGHPSSRRYSCLIYLSKSSVVGDARMDLAFDSGVGRGILRVANTDSNPAGTLAGI